MALPSSGTIKLSQVRTELGLSGNFSMKSSQALGLAGKSGVPVKLSDFYGKSNVVINHTTSRFMRTQYGIWSIGNAQMQADATVVRVDFTFNSAVTAVSVEPQTMSALTAGQYNVRALVGFDNTARTAYIEYTINLSYTTTNWSGFSESFDREYGTEIVKLNYTAGGVSGQYTVNLYVGELTAYDPVERERVD